MVNPLSRAGGRLCIDQVPLDLLALEYGTPLYAYSRASIDQNWHTLDRALAAHPHLICYAVKANSNLAVLNLLARNGSGFDIVSGGELARVIAAGGDPAKVVFSGVGKSDAELAEALAAGVGCINLESESEIARLAEIAAGRQQVAAVALRVNPNIDARSHPYISTGLKENKFGVDIDQAAAIYQALAQSQWLEPVGIDCHIGSQLVELAPLREAISLVLKLSDSLRQSGITLEHIDVGGGLGIRYADEQPPTLEAYAALLLELFQGRQEQIVIEPGRSLVGNAGVMLTRVIALKPGEEKSFALVDAAMNDLLRPSLYDAWHDIEPVVERPGEATRSWDVVGPICETGDFLGKDRALALSEGDLLAVLSCGAYGFTMASNYNTRPRAAEVMIDGDSHFLVRQRETVEQLLQGESLLPS